MKIKILNIYPDTTDPTRGTVHILLEKYGLEIKNILYGISKKTKKFQVIMPYKKYMKEDKKFIHVDDVFFGNPGKHKLFVKKVIEAILNEAQQSQPANIGNIAKKT